MSTPAQRRMAAKKAALARYAKHGTEGCTAAATAAFMKKFEDAVDPDRVLPEEERLRRAAMARKAHFTGLSLLASQKRGRPREPRP